jgi:hypothetical protein
LLAVAPVPPEGAHEYVYPAVPPLGVTVADPVLIAHPVGELVAVAESTVGSVMLNVAVPVHPLLSVIVHVYVPIAIALDVEPVPPDGDQA